MTAKLWPALGAVLLLAGCEAAPVRNSVAAPRTAAALRDLIGEYDNHAERTTEGAAKAPVVAIPALHQWISPTREAEAMFWRLRLGEGQSAAEGRWLVREEGGALVPYRPLTAAANAAFDARSEDYKFQAADWAALGGCALRRDGAGGFSYRVDAGACSALLPGLGSSAALLPQRFSLTGDTLVLATVSDGARGADATTTSHRVRWFTGWDALNGAGPKAAADSQDWHIHRDLRLHSEGGRVPLRWRDGVPSGYSVELARLIYRERNTEVLRLAVIEDSSGRTLSYAWGDPDATRIGINLGWLQVGLDLEGSAPAQKGRGTP